MYAQLGDSYQWRQLNNDNIITDKVQKILKEGKIITTKDIPQAMLRLKNRSKSPLITELTNAINNGDIIMVYAPGIKIPTYLPFIISQVGAHLYRGYVFLNNLDASQGDSELELNDKKFRVSVESCYISLRIRQIGDSAKLRSTALIRNGAGIYSAIVNNCLNRKHSIKLDERVWNALLAIFSRFYIVHVLGCNNLDKDTLQSYCYYNCTNIDTTYMNRIFDQMDEDDFKDIGALISRLPKIEEFKGRLSKLTVSNFIESYINMYDASMLLALEVFPYFLYNIMAVNDGTYINNYQSLKNYVGTDGKKIYADLVVAIGN